MRVKAVFTLLLLLNLIKFHKLLQSSFLKLLVFIAYFEHVFLLNLFPLEFCVTLFNTLQIHQNDTTDAAQSS